MKTEKMSNVQIASIANGAAVSDVVDLAGASSLAFLMPSSWTAANLTFQGSDAPDGTFADVYDDAGNELTVTAAASRCIVNVTATKLLAGLRYIKVRSGTTGTPVNQAAARAIAVILK